MSRASQFVGKEPVEISEQEKPWVFQKQNQHRQKLGKQELLQQEQHQQLEQNLELQHQLEQNLEQHLQGKRLLQQESQQQSPRKRKNKPPFLNEKRKCRLH